MEKSFLISVLKDDFAICRLNAFDGIPDWALQNPLSSVTRTSEELSIVCPTNVIPENLPCEQNWKCLKIHGPLDISEVGIISKLTSALAAEEISVFVLSTYDTDHIFVKTMNIEKTVKVLTDDGHQIFWD
jgi:hypothetical protein